MMMSPNYKPVGGVESCTLYPADAVTTALFSSDGCEVELGGTPIEVTLLEGASHYDETSVFNHGASSVSHSLHLVADRGESQQWLDDSFLERGAYDGFIAVIALNDGRRLLVGYSAHLGNEQPLRLEKISSASGSTLRETPSVALHLISHDTDFSPEILESV